MKRTLTQAAVMLVGLSLAVATASVKMPRGVSNSAVHLPLMSDAHTAGAINSPNRMPKLNILKTSSRAATADRARTTQIKLPSP